VVLHYAEKEKSFHLKLAGYVLAADVKNYGTDAKADGPFFVRCAQSLIT
jgi:hypothetical protein